MLTHLLITKHLNDSRSTIRHIVRELLRPNELIILKRNSRPLLTKLSYAFLFDIWFTADRPWNKGERRWRRGARAVLRQQDRGLLRMCGSPTQGVCALDGAIARDRGESDFSNDSCVGLRSASVAPYPRAALAALAFYCMPCQRHRSGYE